ncbi:FHA domain-containing protein [Mycobacterium hubeiense]|uniref:FHA domain-containing protein n=1 Tax=Mycobacterium hubeiense TaxID=1867256 RepID=UPI000C7EB843|nr:FHA domain-containing protein [Mycobacterium sp. QGD 101]
MSLGPGPVLQFADEQGHIHEHQLDTAERVSIGRSPDATIPLLTDGSVSRLHAIVEWVDTHWTVVDDGLSRNGTFVNGERITGRRPLHSGDKIRIGEAVLTFRDATRPAGKTTSVAGEIPTRSSLTDAQLRVLIALCRPYKGGATYATPTTNQQIADELYLSTETVKTHLRALFTKFGLDENPHPNKRARLVERAMLSGVVTDRDL